MLMEWLHQRDCVKTGLELFINHHHVNNQLRAATPTSRCCRDGGSEAAGPKFQHFAADVGGAERVAAGFIWIQMDALAGRL